MAESTLSILVKAIGAAKAATDIGKVDSAVGRIGARAKAGVGAAVGNIARIGAVAAGGIAVAVKTGLDDLAELESATSAVTGAIKQMGQAGQLTGAQVAEWANSIEADIGAAFDDKAITRATATLIRFGSVTPKNLRKAMVVMTDLAAKTGDVDSAATLLAKALADPTKAAGKLARSGVVLTKVQQDQLKALVKAGKQEQAQALILDLLAQKTRGAAAASQGPYARSLKVLADVSEDARKALAEGFLPVIEKVANLLSKQLAKPETMKNIREFGQGLAKGLDSLVEIAGKLPWSTIGDSLKLGGTGAKAILDAFISLPPWVQTAVLTGWGLNKLTGGALGGIVGELGKGLIKGVLGMNAGVVNINAGVVNGAGGGLPGKGGGGLLGGAAKAIIPVAIVAGAVEISGITDPQHQYTDPTTGLTKIFRGTNDKLQTIANLERAATALQQRANDGDTFARQQLAGVNAKLSELNGLTGTSNRDTDKLESTTGLVKTAIGTLDATARSQLGGVIGQLQSTRGAVTAAGAVAKSGGVQAASAIRAKRWQFKNNNTVFVSTRVSVRESIKTQTTMKRYGNVLS